MVSPIRPSGARAPASNTVNADANAPRRSGARFASGLRQPIARQSATILAPLV